MRSKANRQRLRIFVLAACVTTIMTVLQAQEAERDEPLTPKTEISVTDVAAAQQFGATLGISEWLGPLAPVGLSPFFGITCLSGMSIWGEGWVSADNPMLGRNSPLNNQAVFWTFLVLTVITSAPRLTKVSKPFAQAVDQIETWAAIITLITLKIVLAASAAEGEPTPEIKMGSFSLTVDAILVIAAAVNIFVINAVKFFFETLIWITPVPTIDAVFEIANKAVCGILMAIYGFSPMIAMILNLVILGISLLIFRWAYRRQIFFRTILADAAWAFFAPPKSVDGAELVVFPESAFGPFAARTKCIFSKTDDGWKLVQRRLLRSDITFEWNSDGTRAAMERGYLTNCVRLSGEQTAALTFSRFYNGQLQELADAIGSTPAAAGAGAIIDRAGLKAELG